MKNNTISPTENTVSMIEGESYSLSFDHSYQPYDCANSHRIRVTGFEQYLIPNPLYPNSWSNYREVSLIPDMGTQNITATQDSYFSGNKEAEIKYFFNSTDPENQSFDFYSDDDPDSTPALSFTTTIIDSVTTVTIIDDEPVPNISFSGDTHILEGENIALSIALDVPIDSGFQLKITATGVALLSPQSLYLDGSSFTTEILKGIVSDKITLSQFTLSGYTVEDSIYTGSSEVSLTVELIKDGVSYSSSSTTITILDNELEEELGYDCPMTEHPVNIRTGNKYLKHTDAEFSYSGKSYQVVRHYNSTTDKWSFEFERQLKFEANKVKVIQGDGKVISYTDNGGVFTPDVPTLVDLTNVGGYYTVNLPNGSTERYSGAGQLLSKTNRDSTRLIYENEPSKITVKDTFGDSLYTVNLGVNNSVSSIITADGETISYTYTNNDLVSVSNTNGQLRTYTYSTKGLTQVIENGYVLNTITYDSKGRVTQSKVGATGDYETFTYGNLQTTVTNSLGKKAVYSYIKVNERFKIASVNGIASTNCVSSNSSYQYDTKGFIVSKTDSRGVITTYQRDVSGWEISRTEAAGTTNERIIVTEWDRNLDLPLTITAPKFTIKYTYDNNGMVLKKEVVPTIVQL